jgi:hypothetical protein
MSTPVFQLGIGLFHLCLDLVWAILNVRQGHLSVDESLSHFFLVILEKTRLGNLHPDYHTLLAALMQILDGLLLDAWRLNYGYPNVAFAESKPSPEKLIEIADKIIHNHATPTRITSSTTNQ